MLNGPLKLNTSNTEFLSLFHAYIIWTYPRFPHLNKCNNSLNQKPRIRTLLLSFPLSQIQFISRSCFLLLNAGALVQNTPPIVCPHSYMSSSWQVNPTSNPRTRTATVTSSYICSSHFSLFSSSIPEVTLSQTLGLLLFGFLKNSSVLYIYTCLNNCSVWVFELYGKSIVIQSSEQFCFSYLL